MKIKNNILVGDYEQFNFSLKRNIKERFFKLSEETGITASGYLRKLIIEEIKKREVEKKDG